MLHVSFFVCCFLFFFFNFDRLSFSRYRSDGSLGTEKTEDPDRRREEGDGDRTRSGGSGEWSYRGCRGLKETDVGTSKGVLRWSP